MRAVFFDCFAGVSGDMVLGALIDLGINYEVFKRELSKLNISGYDIEINKKESSSIIATDVKVILTEEYSSNHSNEHKHHRHHAKNLMDVEAIIDNSGVNHRVKAFGKQIFKEIARAEALVHNKDIYEVQFHEVGAVNSIVDVVGVCICIDLLGIEAVYSSLLTENTNAELTTPTGMGIIKTLAKGFGTMPKMYIEGVGYGLGKRQIGRLNAIRVVIGTLFEEETFNEDISAFDTSVGKPLQRFRLNMKVQ